MISYDYYRVFYYVCRYRNFTKAANALSTSQSSISHTIRNLEHALSCRLFVRGNRGIELTADGVRLYNYVAAGIEQFSLGEAEFINNDNKNSGMVSIGATETALHCYLFDALDRFHLKYPDIHFKINNFSTNDAVSAVKNGNADMAVTAAPFNIDNSFKVHILKNFNDILIAGSSFKHLTERQYSLHELIEYPFVCFSKGTRSREFIEDFFSSNGLSLNPAIESATSDLILPMVKHNLGIGYIPENIALNALNNEEVFKINVLEKIPGRDICLLYDSHQPQNQAAREFRRFLMN